MTDSVGQAGCWAGATDLVTKLIALGLLGAGEPRLGGADAKDSRSTTFIWTYFIGSRNAMSLLGASGTAFHSKRIVSRVLQRVHFSSATQVP